MRLPLVCNNSLWFVKLFSALYDREAIRRFNDVDNEGTPFGSHLPLGAHFIIMNKLNEI